VLAEEYFAPTELDSFLASLAINISLLKERRISADPYPELMLRTTSTALICSHQSSFGV